MKALIAEDDEFFRNLLTQLLSSEFELSLAEDGTQALSQLRQDDCPLLAILDWVMPGLSGPELCRQLRADKKTANIYIILLTARNSADDIVAGLRSGADDYVTKPFQPEELRARVRLGRRIVELQQCLADQKSRTTPAVEDSPRILTPEEPPLRERQFAFSQPWPGRPTY